MSCPPAKIYTPWTQSDLVKLCIAIEAVCVEHGCHVAMTGGCLYKTGRRKDADILFYRIRQANYIDLDGLLESLSRIGVTKISGFGWVYKLDYEGKPIDAFFPEEKLVKSTQQPTRPEGSSGCCE
jgi:hypothetical protein